MAEKHPKKPNDAKALARWNNEGGAPASGDVSTRKHPKRPRDLNQWAKHMVDLATGEVEHREPKPEEQGKDPAAVALGRRGGLKGGKARAEKLTPEQRSEAARKAASSRWRRREHLIHHVHEAVPTVPVRNGEPLEHHDRVQVFCKHRIANVLCKPLVKPIGPVAPVVLRALRL